VIDSLLVDPNPSSPSTGRSALSRALGRDLPEDYLTWVERFGGSSLRSVIAMPDENGNAVLAYFDNAEDVASVYLGRTGFARNIPRDFAAVGYGPGGGVCISVSDDDFGSVWFANYDLANELLGADDSTFADDSELPQIMTKLSDDWPTFLASR
jgi:hypothetical protein